MMMRQGAMYTPTTQLMEQTKKLEEERKEVAAESQPNEAEGDKTAIREVTGNMVDNLMNSENPKHKNSKFLKFLLKLNHGAYELKDDKLVKNEEKMSKFRNTYTDL